MLLPPQPTTPTAITSSIRLSMRCQARRLPGRPKSRRPASAVPPAAYQVPREILVGLPMAAPEDAVVTVSVSVAAVVPLTLTLGCAREQVGGNVLPPLTLQVRLTVPVKPAAGVTFILVVPDPPWGTVIVAGEALSVKEPDPPPPPVAVPAL